MSDEKNGSVSSKMAKLDELVAWFDGDEFELEQALEKFTEAKALADEIEKDLLELQNTVTVIDRHFDEAGE